MLLLWTHKNRRRTFFRLLSFPVNCLDCCPLEVLLDTQKCLFMSVGSSFVDDCNPFLDQIRFSITYGPWVSLRIHHISGFLGYLFNLSWFCFKHLISEQSLHLKDELHSSFSFQKRRILLLVTDDLHTKSKIRTTKWFIDQYLLHVSIES